MGWIGSVLHVWISIVVGVVFIIVIVGIYILCMEKLYGEQKAVIDDQDDNLIRNSTVVVDAGEQVFLNQLRQELGLHYEILERGKINTWQGADKIGEAVRMVMDGEHLRVKDSLKVLLSTAERIVECIKKEVDKPI